MAETEGNLRQAVPFFRVTNMDASIRFYIDGLGFQMKNKWVSDGTVRWCWLQRDAVALMLQDMRTDNGGDWKLEGKPGLGVAITFICKDALAFYHEVKARGMNASKPFVGNGMWVTSLNDPDGYHVDFESPTDTAEDTEYSEEKS